MLIIDCHCHYGPGDGLVGPWDTRADIGKFMHWSKEAGIHRTNLFAAFHSDYAWANEHVAKLVGRHPERFYGFAFVHSERDAGRVFGMLKRAVQEFGFRGIKAHRHDARLTREVCEAARAFKLPILYDVMGEVSAVELLATEYPDVNFIIPHLGSFADDWKAQVLFLPMLERHPNVFTDTSGVRRFDLLEQAAKRAGPDKILFGTDGPWLHPRVELEKVFALKLTPQAERLVLSGNFLRLIEGVQEYPLKVPKYRGLVVPKNADPWVMERVISQ